MVNVESILNSKKESLDQKYEKIVGEEVLIPSDKINQWSYDYRALIIVAESKGHLELATTLKNSLGEKSLEIELGLESYLGRMKTTLQQFRQIIGDVFFEDISGKELMQVPAPRRIGHNGPESENDIETKIVEKPLKQNLEIKLEYNGETTLGGEIYLCLENGRIIPKIVIEKTKPLIGQYMTTEKICKLGNYSKQTMYHRIRGKNIERTKEGILLTEKSIVELFSKERRPKKYKKSPRKENMSSQTNPLQPNTPIEKKINGEDKVLTLKSLETLVKHGFGKYAENVFDIMGANRKYGDFSKRGGYSASKIMDFLRNDPLLEGIRQRIKEENSHQDL